FFSEAKKLSLSSPNFISSVFPLNLKLFSSGSSSSPSTLIANSFSSNLKSVSNDASRSRDILPRDGSTVLSSGLLTVKVSEVDILVRRSSSKSNSSFLDSTTLSRVLALSAALKFRSAFWVSDKETNFSLSLLLLRGKADERDKVLLRRLTKRF